LEKDLKDAKKELKQEQDKHRDYIQSLNENERNLTLLDAERDKNNRLVFQLNQELEKNAELQETLQEAQEKVKT
jgi:hypothetical protein